MSINSIDALGSAEIKNNVTDPNEWKDTSISFSTNSKSEMNEQLDNILSDTTIKRACCLGRDYKVNGQKQEGYYGIDVRIPLPKLCDKNKEDNEYCLDANDLSNDYFQKFNFYDINIGVPKELCNTLDGDYSKPAKDNDAVTDCDTFFTAYCKNSKAFYENELDQINKSIDPNGYATDYKPECACLGYVYVDPVYDVSPKCMVATGCSDDFYDTGKVFLDTYNREKCADNVTICQSVSNWEEADLVASSVEYDTNQYCGSNISNQDNTILGLKLWQFITIIIAAILILLLGYRSRKKILKAISITNTTKQPYDLTPTIEMV
jgi:hypothetical protein